MGVYDLKIAEKRMNQLQKEWKFWWDEYNPKRGHCNASQILIWNKLCDISYQKYMLVEFINKHEGKQVYKQYGLIGWPVLSHYPKLPRDRNSLYSRR